MHCHVVTKKFVTQVIFGLKCVIFQRFPCVWSKLCSIFKFQKITFSLSGLEVATSLTSNGKGFCETSLPSNGKWVQERSLDRNRKWVRETSLPCIEHGFVRLVSLDGKWVWQTSLTSVVKWAWETSLPSKKKRVGRLVSSEDRDYVQETNL